MDRSYPGPTEQDVTAIDARRKELHVAWFLGYRTGDVDTYLDEVVEARKDTTVLIHPLTDYRRLLPIEKLGQVIEAANGFLLHLG